jgi:hypothetical protein
MQNLGGEPGDRCEDVWWQTPMAVLIVAYNAKLEVKSV